jgi:hypothetical protein
MTAARRLRIPAALLLWRECNPKELLAPSLCGKATCLSALAPAEGQPSLSCMSLAPPCSRLEHGQQDPQLVLEVQVEMLPRVASWSSTFRSKSAPQCLRLPRRSQAPPSNDCMLPPVLMLRYGSWGQMLLFVPPTIGRYLVDGHLPTVWRTAALHATKANGAVLRSWYCGANRMYKVHSPQPRLLDHLPIVNLQYRLQR